jgi:hypothetical protein
MRQMQFTIRLIAAIAGLASAITFGADEFGDIRIRNEVRFVAEPGWPEGVLAILNDVTCTEKSEEDLRFHFEGPHDDSWYGLAIRNMDDVNRLVRYFAAIKAESLKLYLYAEPGWTVGRGEGAFFRFGNQKLIDEWYSRLPEVEPGVRKFGAHRWNKPPTAEIGLGLYVGHSAVDLEKLEVPADVNITTATAAAYRAEHVDEFKKIDAFIERQKAKQQTTVTHRQWLADAFAKTQSIKPGMTRADLETRFDHDGGALRDQSQYVLRECPYIKIVVNFQLPSAAAGNDDWSRDKITTVSKPFLEAPKRE